MPNDQQTNFTRKFSLEQFNIDITDHAEVTNETRRALGLKECREDRSIVPNLPLCVDITLKTEDGYDMLLEVWTLSIKQEQNSPAIRALNNVYSSFSSLLKSIIAVSRATPAYKLSRRTSETYRITHSISAGKAADLTKLGKCSYCVDVDVPVPVSDTRQHRSIAQTPASRNIVVKQTLAPRNPYEKHQGTHLLASPFIMRALMWL